MSTEDDQGVHFLRQCPRCLRTVWAQSTCDHGKVHQMSHSRIKPGENVGVLNQWGTTPAQAAKRLLEDL